MVADLHHFNTDTDPAFHFNADPDPTSYVNADPDPDPHQSYRYVNLRPMVYKPPGLHFEPLRLLIF